MEIKVRGPHVPRDAIRKAVEIVQARPRDGQITFSIETKSDEGVAAVSETAGLRIGDTVHEGRRGQFTMRSDEPKALLGADSAPSPAEYVLKGLAGCYMVTLASLAVQRGIFLESVEMSLDFDMDLRGFLGVDEETRKGAERIVVRLHIEAPDASPEDVTVLVRELELSSPIRDTLANPVDVRTLLN